MWATSIPCIVAAAKLCVKVGDGERRIVAGLSDHISQRSDTPWRKIQLPKVIEGIKFTIDIETARDHAAA